MLTSVISRGNYERVRPLRDEQRPLRANVLPSPPVPSQMSFPIAIELHIAHFFLVLQIQRQETVIFNLSCDIRHLTISNRHQVHIVNCTISGGGGGGISDGSPESISGAET